MKKERSKFAPKNPKTGHSTKSKRPVGRPRIELDEEQLLKLAQCGMTDDEICNLLEISGETLHNFRAILKKGRSNLSQSIKRTQLEVALKERDKTMLIWVGKQYAKQKEKQETEHKGEMPTQQIVFYNSESQPKIWDENS